MSAHDLQRLSEKMMGDLPATVIRPAYRLDDTRIGIVHIGVGAFHRAHQAVYINDLLATHPDWAICGVSLHSTDVRDVLRPQDGLYTLLLLGEQTQLRMIGSIRELLCARDESTAILARLADPSVRLVTLTITEKGYCLAGQDLDTTHPDIVHDRLSRCRTAPTPEARACSVHRAQLRQSRRERSSLAPGCVAVRQAHRPDTRGVD
jgi:fructuronate reductase